AGETDHGGERRTENGKRETRKARKSDPSTVCRFPFAVSRHRIPARRRRSMNLFNTAREMDDFLRGSETVGGEGRLRVTDAADFRERVVESLVWTAVFGAEQARGEARSAIRQAAASLGVLPA